MISCYYIFIILYSLLLKFGHFSSMSENVSDLFWCHLYCSL